ncbi:hypothetical protein RP20_CCG024992 [Aedes albopictus]|nr:hypothetical protein RP20_CCG024992 [Aedes albopictus]
MSSGEPDSAGSHGLGLAVTLGGGSSTTSSTTGSTLSIMEPPASIIMKAKEEPDCDMERNIDSSMDSSALATCLSTTISALRASHNASLSEANRGNSGDDNLSDNSEPTSEQRASAAAQLLESLKNNLNNNNNSSAINNNNLLHPNNNNNNNNGNRKLFECDVCNMKFSNGANMRRHKMRHTGVKPYECRVCQKRFFRKDHLAEHFTTHTKTLPYHCPICNRGFQRQIAMRAHFQNEHVGQHDLVKTCPLCSYRAGTMKSLRVHFFNRHGIDLDNPGPGTPSSLLLALDQHNPANLLPALAAMNAVNAFSDSGDSMRSVDNGTPPMHFLTPHVEISMADNNEVALNCSRDALNGINSGNEPSSAGSNNGSDRRDDRINDRSTPTPSISSGLDIKAIVRPPNGGSPSSPHSADSNAPSSSHLSSMLPSQVQSSRHIIFDNSITPSISLIPIKQEPTTNDEYNETKPRSISTSENQTSNISNSSDTTVTPSSSLTSLIKGILGRIPAFPELQEKVLEKYHEIPKHWKNFKTNSKTMETSLTEFLEESRRNS